MIKGCLHLPLFPVYNCSPTSASTVGPQLLVFSANEHASSTHSKQATQTDKQTITTKNEWQSKEKLRKSALNDPTCCYDRDNARTGEKELSLNEHDYQGWQHNGEDRLHIGCILFNKK